MLSKIAGALLAATILAAPAVAEGLSKDAAPITTTQTAPKGTVATQPAKSDVKAASTVKTIKGKHARKHFRSHLAKHGTSVKHVKGAKSVKHVAHIKSSKHIRAKARTNGGMQAAVKPVNKTGSN